jgi:hypothetical protein
MGTRVKIKEATGNDATSRVRTPYDKHLAYDKHIAYLIKYDEIKPEQAIKKIKRG